MGDSDADAGRYGALDDAGRDEITISSDEITRAKRAVVVLMEAFKEVWGRDRKPPLDLRQDVQTLMGLLRKIEKL